MVVTLVISEMRFEGNHATEVMALLISSMKHRNTQRDLYQTDREKDKR